MSPLKLTLGKIKLSDIEEAFQCDSGICIIY